MINLIPNCMDADLPLTIMDIFLELILPVIAGIYFVYRVVRVFFVSRSHARLVERVARDPELGKKIAAELDFLYGKLPLPESDQLDELLMLTSRQLGKYKILGVQQLDENRYLFITQCHDVTYENHKKIEKPDEIYFYNFLLSKSVEQNQYEVYSGSYNCLSDKNLMTGFGSVLFKILREPVAV